MNLLEDIKAIPPAQGYHIRGNIHLLYGHRSEKIERSIDETITGQDAQLLASAETEQAAAAAIANVYFDLDLDETEPPFTLHNLERWNLVIEPCP